ncbi:alanine-glyoxylate aminotransferase [Capsaspora owczarzaki ATCC 30864]|uniref:alanine--glyoxylate transaminase n=1 Tax=Capsaspora owczarzaki (strain ATCC 30864) TaxID=595528 RepID=A0A0D2WNN3_CAPO3|nr:alanine-glyoxylate aminotransferase [Capsaspora owczarzaki ATCC 30864]KJE92790.1 alanine-glyoxylate aminotransferase [Capsaspora owczarzaki ATCC 30864]|eukprot:XP_004363417.1 alanine-glyoxylate aminotransferase [Capsaspora owczarzaki ATCC 30864]
MLSATTRFSPATSAKAATTATAYCAQSMKLSTSAAAAATATVKVPPMPKIKDGFKPAPYTGLTFEQASDLRKRHVGPATVTYYKKPLMIQQGHMQWLFDDKNNRYLDMFAGIVTVSVGHCHPHVLKAAEDQLKKLWHTTNIYLHPTIHEYAAKLTSKMPGNLKVAYFVNSGSEANDLAMLMSRLYTGNFDILSLRNGYHGMSPYTMGLTSLSNWKYNLANGFGVHPIVNPDPYRGPWGGPNCRDSPCTVGKRAGENTCTCGGKDCKAALQYADQIKDHIIHATHGKVAGFFAESIQGVGGTVQFPNGYLKKAYEIVRERGGVCIADEVQTGFGRLGSHFWGFETHGVIPDIVTMAKGIGNGWPLAAVVTTPEIAKTLAQKLTFNTYGGNPVACAVGKATLEVMEQENTQENSKVVGTHLLQLLDGIRQRHPQIVGDVRGKGLMIGVEFVHEQDPNRPASQVCADVFEMARDRGVLLGKGGLYGNVLRIKPPMIVTREDVEFAAAVIEEAIQKLGY